jgi:hypothetical protein
MLPIVLYAVPAMPYLAAIAASYFLWRGLRGAGVNLKPDVLIVLALLVCSPELVNPGMGLTLYLRQLMPAYILRLWLPLLSGILVGSTLFRVLRGAGLGLNKAVWFGVGAAMALLVAAGAYILANAAIVGGHAFG